MKMTAKLVGGFGAVIVTLSAAGTVAFAATSNSPATPPSSQSSGNKVSSTVKTVLRSERAEWKQLQTENKQLNAQIKSDYATWHSAHLNPLKQLTATEQSTLKSLRSEMKAEQSTARGLREQVESLHSQLVAAKAAKNATSVSQLRSQIKTLAAQVKADEQQVKSDKQQMASLLPSGVVKAFHEQQAALKQAIGADQKELKLSNQQLRADEQTLKTDRQNKNWTGVTADLQKVNADLAQVITEKQQLVKHFPS